jgi:hypothetical protein
MGSVSLQFSSCNDASSLAIRLYDHGLWSHVDAVLNDGNLLGSRDDQVGGKPSGVQIRPDGYIKFATTKRVIIPCADAQEDAFYAFLTGQIDKPYDETAILAFIVGRNWRAEDSWFCSELVGSALEQSTVFAHNLAVASNKLTPSGLYLASSVLVDISNE